MKNVFTNWNQLTIIYNVEGKIVGSNKKFFLVIQGINIISFAFCLDFTFSTNYNNNNARNVKRVKNISKSTTLLQNKKKKLVKVIFVAFLGQIHFPKDRLYANSF